MIKLIYTCGFFLFLLSATICYAANGNPCVVYKSDIKKQPCKTSERLIPEKLLKVKFLNESKASEKPVSAPANSVKNPSSADTFESLITPFLKAVSPHFYDQIIKRDQKSAPVRS